MSTKDHLVSYYVKYIPTPLGMWVKWVHKPTLQQVFDEAMLIEKDMLSLKDSSDINTNQPSTFEKKTNPKKKFNPLKKDQSSFDFENIQKVPLNVSNEFYTYKETWMNRNPIHEAI